MRRFMLLAAMCAALVLALATAAFGQTRGPSGADGTFNCGDFDTQEQAQAFLNQDPGDTNGLDGPPGDAFTGRPGVACEDLPSVGGGTMMPTEPPTQYQQPETPVTDMTTTALPATGGPSLALLAGALLLGTELVLRRR